MHPPAKKKKHGEAETGRGRPRRVREARAASSSHAIGAYAKVSSHHARGACEVSPKWRNEFERSTIETQKSNSNPFRRIRNARREAPRRGKWANRALRASRRGSENTKSENFLEGRIFWRVNAENRNALVVCLPRPPLRAPFFPSLVVLKRYCKTTGTAPIK